MRARRQGRRRGARPSATFARSRPLGVTSLSARPSGTGPGARAGRRSRAGTRARAAAARAGRRGRATTASAIVDAERRRHQHPRQRARASRSDRPPRGRARRRGCPGCRGSPSTPGPEPGTRTRARSKTPAWCSTIVFVGPRQTEYASTHGMISATTTTHETSSKKSRRSQPANVAAPSFANDAGACQSTDLEDDGERDEHEAATSASARSAAAAAARPARSTAGMTSSAMNATSHHSDTFGQLLVHREVQRERRRQNARARRGAAVALVRRQLRPPRAERLERVPELRLLLLLVERGVDVGHDERVDRRREALQFSESAARRDPRAGTRAR